MKINKFGKTMVAVILGATMGFSALAFTACDPKPNTPPINIEEIGEGKITVSLSQDTLTAGKLNDSITVTVEVENLNDKGYSLSIEGTGKDYVQRVDGNKIQLISGMAFQTEMDVTVKATSTVFELVSGAASFKLKPQIIQGNVDGLTTEMFEELGNPSITVSGVVTDVIGTKASTSSEFWNEKRTEYDYTVMMEEGKWYGEWNRKGSKNVDSYNYRRSEELYENSGRHIVEQVYINKDNEVATKPVLDYKSTPAYWEDSENHDGQHLYNHLAQLGVDVESQWEYDATNGVYHYINGPEYNEDMTDFSADMYLRLYLAISMTPMLDNGDTLDQIYITVEDGKITKMEAQTAIEYNAYTASDATEMGYTIVTFNFSDVGETEVPDPEVYEGDEMTDVLKEALSEMRGATNYTFHAVEDQIAAPSVDPDDYTEYSLTSASAVKKARVYDSKSSTGTVGLKGQITEDAILLARTGKYDYGMDDNLYWTEHTGYKQVSDDYYDFFTYDADIMAFHGKQKFKGSVVDKIPQFNFAAELFEFTGDRRVVTSEGIKYYSEFTLKEPAVTKDIAKEVSMHSYANNAQSSTFGTFMIVLDENDKLHSIEFPYNVSGNYLGIIETTYSNVGTTELEEDWDAGYVEREIRNSWSQYPVKYYHADHSTQSPYGDIDANELMSATFGVSNFDNVLRPIAFYNVFGDTMTEAFFEWEEPSEGVYVDYISFNLQVRDEDADENMHIGLAVFTKYIDALSAELATYGFAPEPGYPQEAKDAKGEVYARYMIYVNETYGAVLKIENITTRFFYCDLMPSKIA